MRHIRISVLAAALTQRLFAQTDDVVALTQRALQAQQSGDYVAAADAYRSLLKIRPNEVAAHVNLGIVLVDLGHYDEAIAEYSAADKLLPGDPRIALNAALAYKKSGRVREAAARLAALHTALPQEDKITMLLADCYLQLDENDNVIAVLRPIEAANGSDPALAYMLGTALIRKQQISEGQVYLDRILRNGDTPQARFLLGTRMFESGDYPAAVEQLAQAAELDPTLPQLQSFYGQALLVTGDADGAAAAFQKELAANPNDYISNLALAQILIVRRRFAEAVPLAKRALSIRPNSGEAHLGFGESLSGSGDFQQARPQLEAAAESFPKSLEVHQALLAVYKQLHMTSNSIREAAVVQQLQRAATAVDRGPKVNEIAPGFTLPETGTGRQLNLEELYRKSGAVLIFGSYSCPNFRSSAEELKKLYRKYGLKVPFLLVYIREAHADGNWQSTRNLREGVVDLAPAHTLAEKQEHAAMCSRKLHLEFPSVVDDMKGSVESAYAAWPSRLFVVGSDGRILYSSRLTELDFVSADLQAVLRNLTAVTKGMSNE